MPNTANAKSMPDQPGDAADGGAALLRKRAILGFVSAAALVLAAALYLLGTRWDPSLLAHAASLLKIGIVLGVFWLAVPDLDRIVSKTPGWLWMATLAALAIIILRPWSALWAGPILAALWGLSLTWSHKASARPKL